LFLFIVSSGVPGSPGSPCISNSSTPRTGWIVPPADTPSYTGSSWPTGKSEKQRIQEQPGVPAKDKSVGEGFTPPEKPVLGVEEFEIPGDPGDPGTPDETIKRNKSWLDRENELKAQGMTSEEINSTIATEKNWRYNTEEIKVAKNVGMTEVIKGKPKVDAKPGGTGYNYTIGDRTVDKSEYCSHPDANHSSCN
jgi:hypothetical protein